MSHTFDRLLLIAPILQALREEGYETATPIQEQAIPAALNGQDLIASAQTGTGKSAAFCIPLIQLIHQQKHEAGHQGIRALVLTPTRELATQVNESFATYGRHTQLNHTAIFGGIPRKVQIDHLSHEIDILVATPGRLLDLVEKGYVDLSQLTHFVLDEADNMLNLGFIEEVKRVIERLPAVRQTLLFSATIPFEIAELAKSLLKNPLRIEIAAEKRTAEEVVQSLYYVEEELKLNLLLHLLQSQQVESAFIFTQTRKGADELCRYLCEHDWAAEAIHSERSQHERQQALHRFKSREIKLLIATDVAARGIDVNQVSHVFNIGLPQEAESYIHRIGRTGRAGHSGKAITLCSPLDIKKLREVERLIRMKLPLTEGHLYANVALMKQLLKAEEELAKKERTATKERRRK